MTSKHAPQQEAFWSLNPGLADIVEQQELVYTTQFCFGPRRTSTGQDDLPEMEIPYEFARVFIGFEHIRPDEVLVFAARKSAGTVASGQIEKSFDALSAKDVEQN